MRIIFPATALTIAGYLLSNVSSDFALAANNCEITNCKSINEFSLCGKSTKTQAAKKSSLKICSAWKI